MISIPLLAPDRQYRSLEAEINTAVLEVLASGHYIGGATVTELEQELAAYIGTTTCVACNSGTDALYLALRALEIGPGHEVITTPFTFIATAEVISRVGATPVFVDIDPATYNLDLTQVEKAITVRSRALMPVHLFGQPVDMTQLLVLATAHHLDVIEDCAQAAGATWNQQKVGSFGDAGCFSFYPSKNLGGCGDGGAVTCNCPDLAARMRLLQDHGRDQAYRYQTLGINSRLDSLQAAILRVKLQYLDQWNQQRQNLAAHYQQLLQPLPGVVLPQSPIGADSVWNQYTIRVMPRADVKSERDRIHHQLSALGVDTRIYYPSPLHLQSVFAHLAYQPGQLPQAEQATREVLSLPIYPELTFDEQQRIQAALTAALACYP